MRLTGENKLKLSYRVFAGKTQENWATHPKSQNSHLVYCLQPKRKEGAAEGGLRLQKGGRHLM